jgi:Fe-S cluster assembly protein SufD
MPTHRDEAWRYTPAEELTDLLALAVRGSATFELARGQVDLMAGDHGGPRLVFVNGTFAPGASSPRAAAGVTVGTVSELGQSTSTRPELDLDRLDGFLALNALAGDDGAVITVDAEASDPIHIVHVAAPDLDTCLLTHPAAAVLIRPNARATIIESFVGFGGRALTNAATAIEVHDGGAVAYHRVQAESADAAHVGHVRIRAGRASTVRCTSFSLGGRIARTAFDITLRGDGSQLDLDGLYQPTGQQRHDQVITVEHAGSQTRSNQRFKGVVDDRARGSFTGHVMVPEGSSGIAADQTNHSLLLTPTAESDSRPWLEILADDVRCAHGATVGRLDEEAMFYLRSRGIPEPEARQVLIEGFTREIVDAVGIETLRDHLEGRLRTRRQRRADGDR